MVQEDEGTEEWNEITPSALADKDKVEINNNLVGKKRQA